MPDVTKPYIRCIDCDHIGVNCGPDFLAMDIPHLCEWARLRKDYLHRKDKKWTIAYISEQSDISKNTVDRFFNGRLDDLNFTTAARIIRVLVNGTRGQYPCMMAEDKEYTDIMKFKRLLAAGVISQEEFDAKKKQILGL